MGGSGNMFLRACRAGAGSGWSRSGLLIFTLTLAVALSSCASSNTGAERTTPPTGVTSTTAPAPTAPPTPNQTPLTMQQAWGTVTIHTLPLVVGTNRYFAFDNVATPDGQWLVGDNEPCNLIQNPGLPSYAVLYNVATRQMITLQLLQTTPARLSPPPPMLTG